ncbi:hypothetical protein [Maritimibacter fusiformis]|uniref:hypothetical protein n=1 Tax=Maritimibacter fusiformis TaxID=2603819 RepID=UPI0016528ABE|nr:hypothetical protein [Maritimibacter fusiformis]
MTLPRKIALAALVVLGVLLAGVALLALRDVYQNHIARECGAECGAPPSDGTVEGGF